MWVWVAAGGGFPLPGGGEKKKTLLAGALIRARLASSVDGEGRQALAEEGKGREEKGRERAS